MDDITVKNIEQIEPYAGANAIPGIRFRPAGASLGISAWGMNILELDANTTGYPEHDHADDGHEEVYLVLRGSLVLQAAGTERVLAEGDLVHVPGAVSRKFVTRGQGATLLAIGGTPGQPYRPSMGRPAPSAT